MGMFDTVIFEAPCQSCGVVINGFQTKDGDCVLAEITVHELFKKAGKARFYTSCEHCGVWNEYRLEPSDGFTVVPV